MRLHIKASQKVSKNIIICYRSKYNVPNFEPSGPHIPAASTILETASSGLVVHVQQHTRAPPLLSGFSLPSSCVEQRAEQSNGAEATDNSDAPQNCGHKWGKHGRVQGGKRNSCFPAVIHHIAGEQSVWRRQKFSFQSSETAPGTCSGPLGDDVRLVTVVDVAPRGDPNVSAAGLFETLFHVCAGLMMRVQRGDGGGGELHSGLMMGDVCGPALKSIQTTWAPRWVTARTLRGHQGG